MVEGKITVRNLAVKEVKTSSSAANLSKAVMEVLDEYNINLEQIVSVTCDNLANMILSTIFLSNLSEEESGMIEEEVETNENQMDEDSNGFETDPFHVNFSDNSIQDEEMAEESETENETYYEKLCAYIAAGCQLGLVTNPTFVKICMRTYFNKSRISDQPYYAVFFFSRKFRFGGYLRGATNERRLDFTERQI
jgi:hypothetical protein